MQLEGQQSVLSALKMRQRKFEVLLVKANAKTERFQNIISEAEKQNVPIKYLSIAELDQMGHGKTHGGIIALCSHRKFNTINELGEILRKKSGPPLLLILEGVEDGRHLGYIIRSAEALGAHAVLLKKHLWDFDETSVSRSSSGAFERLPLIKFSRAEEISRLDRFDIKFWGCIANAKRTIYEADLTAPVALAVGGEKRGLSGALRHLCSGFIRIPMTSEHATSLSITQAACLIIGEAARQRFVKQQI